MNQLPNALTPAERAFWRRLWRQSAKEKRISDRVLADMLTGKPARKRAVGKVSP